MVVVVCGFCSLVGDCWLFVVGDGAVGDIAVVVF